jgi:hypothetical protein
LQFRTLSLGAIAALLLATAPALAQDTSPPVVQVNANASTTASASAPVETSTEPAVAGRPVPFTLGLGAGTVIGGTSVLAPNAASARFVFSSEWQLEPLVNISVAGTPNAADATETDTTTTLRLGALGRYTYASHGPVDLQLLGGALLGFVAAENGDTLEFNLSYGASVVWYLSEHWSISGDATNPIVTLSNFSPEGADDSVTSYTIGAIWNPTFTAMIHIYM